MSLLQSICSHLTAQYHAVVLPGATGSCLALRICGHEADDETPDWFLEVGLRADSQGPVSVCLTMHSGAAITRSLCFDVHGEEGFLNFLNKGLIPEIRRLPNGMPFLMEAIIDMLDTHISGEMGDDDIFGRYGDGFHLMRADGSWIRVARCAEEVPLGEEHAVLREDRFWYGLTWWGPVDRKGDNAWAVDVFLGIRVVRGHVVPNDALAVVVCWFVPSSDEARRVLVETVSDLVEWEQFTNGPLVELMKEIDDSDLE